jgi:hypothetical protein
MSSLLNPVGPEPASTYWRRRIVVILGILVVLFLLWMLIKPSGSAEPAAATSPSPLQTLATTSPTPSTTTSSTAAPCDDTNIEVTVTSEQSAFSLGTPATFVMKIANNGATPCSRDVGPAANTFTVTSGGFDVWSSDACSPSTDSQTETIPAGEAWAVKGTWDGNVTTDGCVSASPAEAGAYQVVGTNGQLSSEPLSFTIG